MLVELVYYVYSERLSAWEKFKPPLSVHVPQRQIWPSTILLNKTDEWQRIAFKVIEIWQLLLVSWQETN